MFTDLAVEDYQSLKSARLALGRFTVVTGPTGSGKSGAFRAAQLVAFNARGTSYIRRGAAECVVLLGNQGQGWAVSITRGKRGKDAYRIARLINEPMLPEGFMDEPEVDTFTKLGGKVPEEVTQLLGLSELNFAGQFDRPFLLAESAGEVARQLGQLTNVTLIFQAAREAQRRKSQLAGDLRLAETELERVRSELHRFARLPARLKALRRAQEAEISHAAIQQRGTRLQALLSQHSAAQAQLGAVQAVPAVPGLGTLEAQVARAARLRALHEQFGDSEHSVDEQSSFIEAMQALALEAQDGAVTLLRKAGRCPTCGQKVEARARDNSSGHRRASGPVGRLAAVEEGAGEHGT